MAAHNDKKDEKFDCHFIISSVWDTVHVPSGLCHSKYSAGIIKGVNLAKLL